MRRHALEPALAAGGAFASVERIGRLARPRCPLWLRVWRDQAAVRQWRCHGCTAARIGRGGMRWPKGAAGVRPARDPGPAEALVALL